MIELKRLPEEYITNFYVPVIMLVMISFVAELVTRKALMARIVITLSPLFALLVTTNSQKPWILSDVNYITSISVFCGTSFLTIFLVFLHVVLSSRNNPKASDKVSFEHFFSPSPFLKAVFKKVIHGVMINPHI